MAAASYYKTVEPEEDNLSGMDRLMTFIIEINL